MLILLVFVCFFCVEAVPAVSRRKQPNWHLIEPYSEAELNPDFEYRRSLLTQTSLLPTTSFPDLRVLPLFQVSPELVPNGTLPYIVSEGVRRDTYRAVFRNMRRTESQFVMYPYPLNITDAEEDLRVEVSGGAIIGLGTGGSSSESIQVDLGVDMGRSRALYDGSILVLKAIRGPLDLFFESDVFCSALVTYIGHWGPECISIWSDAHLDDGVPKFVFVDPDDLATADVDLLLATVGLLVVPDFIEREVDAVVDLLQGGAGDVIQQFVDEGGVVFASGKSGYLLERIGIIPSQTYNSGTLLTSQTNVAQVLGCEVEEDRKDPAFWSFVKQSMCAGVPRESFILASYRTRSTLPTGVRMLLEFDAAGDSELRYKSTSSGFKWRPGASDFLPRMLLVERNKGFILIDHANPGYHTDYFGWIFNTLFVALGKTMLLNRRVDFHDGLPIPAMESGVILTLNHTIWNIFSEDMINAELRFWVPQDVTVHSGEILYGGVGGVCAADSVMPVPSPAFSEGWRCNWDTIGMYDSVGLALSIEILEMSVTQLRTNVLMGWTEVEFDDTRPDPDLHVALYVGGLYVDTKIAALLRADTNPDPSSFYPLEGEGNYIDNFTPVENKEDTEAYDVVHVAIVPIVTPAVDGDDQSKVMEVVQFWDGYYFQATNGYAEYPFPLDLPTDYDILDYKFLTDKGVLFTANWDTPVKLNKLDRDATFPLILKNTSLDMKNVNYSTSVSGGIVLRQTHFANSDTFFEHATQQLLVYVDTTKEEGATARYGDIHAAIDASRIVPGRDVEKTEKIFVRNDIYFYNSLGQYILPTGINHTHVISIDRYPRYATGCHDGNAFPIVNGYFDKAMPGGLKYNEYGNEVCNRCDKVVIDYDDVAAVSGGSVTKTRYLIPIVDEDITKPSDLMFFDVVTPGEYGTYQGYPEVEFIYAYSFVLPLDPAISRRGGYFDFVVPRPFNADTPAVFFSADHVAFYDQTINKGARYVKATFKRGNMPNEAWGKISYQTVMIQNVDSTDSMFQIDVNVYEMKYDITKDPKEQYFFRETIRVNATRKPHFSLPAIRMEFILNRTSLGSETPTAMMPYELIEPMIRYGVYHQELHAHRTVYGLAESHVVTDPGVVVESGGFSVISQVGTSSIPFIDYLTVGSGQVIPAGMETSRIEWDDIWERRWVQPLRSVFPDVPPIPPPLRNFMMTTTFEMFQTGTQNRVLEWNTEEILDIRVHIKLKNNYPKHFEITTCPDNRIFSVEKGVPSRVFDPSYDTEISSVVGDDKYLSVGYYSFYGDCFTQAGTVLSGQALTAQMIADLPGAKHCSANLLNAADCVDDLIGIPTVSRCSLDPPTGSAWNWAPKILDYYPTNFIKENMWDLTHYDYDDNAFDKAYKYHMDNNLPNLDIGILKPHNIIAHPIFKGYGYSITYDKTMTIPAFPAYRGWWSDNLQNKDHTVLAGQAVSNDISVNKPYDDLIKALDWIEIDPDLVDPGTAKYDRVAQTLRNIYACEFNRHRIRMDTSAASTKFYVNNIYQNNVIPIIPELDRYGPEYTNYECDLGKPQETPTTISQVDNRVFTSDARDWLYFGANLRGGAKESLNVLTRLTPFTERMFEGDAKVNDGGRFVYWNPANGPNSFLVVDNPVNVVKGTRCDLSFDIELFPQSTFTFDADVYHLIRVADDEEILREYASPIYINHYGFGDSSTSVYVGGTEGSSAIVNPGDTTYVKVTFYNNAGWDWNLFVAAIDFDYQGAEPLNANDLMYNLVHAIKVPQVYNFLTLSIPPEIVDHIEIIPSDHCSRMTSLFFDFQNINVATIMDGFKADYFYKLRILPTFPDEQRGRLHEIGISLNYTHNIQSMPSYNDPTGASFHDYVLQIPSIVFGVPFGTNVAPEYQGKVYHSLGTSTNLQLGIPINERFQIMDAKFIHPSDIDTLRTVAATSDNIITNLRNFFNSLTGARVPFALMPAVPTHQGYDFYSCDLSPFFPEYPFRVSDTLPPEAETYMLIYSHAPELPYGRVIVDGDPRLTYRACGPIDKDEPLAGLNYRSVHTKGPFLTVDYEGILLERALWDGRVIQNMNQILYPHESGTMSIGVTLMNQGSDVAYNLNLTLRFDPDVEILLDEMDPDVPWRIWSTPDAIYLYIETGYALGPSLFEVYTIHLRYWPEEELAGRDDVENFPPQRTFIPVALGTIDLTPSIGDNTVVQDLDPYAMDYVLRLRDLVDLFGDRSLMSCSVTLDAIANQPIVDGEPLYYLFWRQNATDEDPDEDSWIFLGRESVNSITTTYPCTSQVYRVITQNRVDEQYLAEGLYDLYHVDPLFVGIVGGVVGAIAFVVFFFVISIIVILAFTWGSTAKDVPGGKRYSLFAGDLDDLEQQGSYFVRGRMIPIYGLKSTAGRGGRSAVTDQPLPDAEQDVDMQEVRLEPEVEED